MIDDPKKAGRDDFGSMLTNAITRKNAPKPVEVPEWLARADAHRIRGWCQIHGIDPAPLLAQREEAAKAEAASALPGVQPEEEPEQNEKPKDGGEAKARAYREAMEKLNAERDRLSGTLAVLSVAAPMDTAREFVKREWVVEDGVGTRFWRGEWRRWNGRFYGVVEEREVRDEVANFLDRARRRSGQDEEGVRFRPQPKHVNEVFDMVKTVVALGSEVVSPTWLDTEERAEDVVVFRNAVVNMVTGESVPATARLWVHGALEFDWNPSAPAGRWERLLEEVHPQDAEAQEFLEEWMAYNMTEETKFQKAAMLIGKTRSGRGTIARMIECLVGKDQYVGLRFDTWVQNENSQEPMIGKRAGVFPDARLKKGKWWGRNFDAGGLDYKSVQLMLSVTGEDTLTLGRKNKTAWRGRLPIKLTVISNDILNVNDAVLPKRFVKVHFRQSFLDREDPDLEEALKAELPGIAARCVRAYGRLLRRGAFVQPRSAKALEARTVASSDPFSAMLGDCFVIEPGARCLKSVAYNVFCRWCEEQGRPDLIEQIPSSQFTKDLADRVPGLDDFRPHGEQRQYVGFRVRKKNEESR
jgi:putative DNA primase/helicase